MSKREMVRSGSNRVVAGVAAGLADYFGVDPVIMRIAFIILALAGGPGFLIYLILWIIMPQY
ncbi:MAG: PspC domain-containing protein [Chloroflexota bacterium]